MTNQSNKSDTSAAHSVSSTRRHWLATAGACGLVSAGGSTSNAISVSTEEANPIVLENRQQGTLNWKLGKIRIDPSTKYRCPWVEGYASHASIQSGETLQLMISTATPMTVEVELFRLGYYQGLGGRSVGRYERVACRPQPMPSMRENRLMFCEWEPSLEIRIPETWTSGVYVAKLTEGTEGLQSYIIFVVRDPRRSDLIFQCSDHTWQAYNRWPSQFSLYDDGVNVWHWGDAWRS